MEKTAYEDLLKREQTLRHLILQADVKAQKAKEKRGRRIFVTVSIITFLILIYCGEKVFFSVLISPFAGGFFTLLIVGVFSAATMHADITWPEDKYFKSLINEYLNLPEEVRDDAFIGSFLY